MLDQCVLNDNQLQHKGPKAIAVKTNNVNVDIAVPRPPSLEYKSVIIPATTGPSTLAAVPWNNLLTLNDVILGASDWGKKRTTIRNMHAISSFFLPNDSDIGAKRSGARPNATLYYFSERNEEG